MTHWSSALSLSLPTSTLKACAHRLLRLCNSCPYCPLDWMSFTLLTMDMWFVWLQASATIQMRSAIFWDITQHRVVMWDRLMVPSSWSSWHLKVGPIGCPKTLVRNYCSMLCNIPEQRRFKLQYRRWFIYLYESCSSISSQKDEPVFLSTGWSTMVWKITNILIVKNDEMWSQMFCTYVNKDFAAQRLRGLNCSLKTFHFSVPEFSFITPCQLNSSCADTRRDHGKIQADFHSMYYQGKVLSED